MWHRFLLFLRIRKYLDWAPPGLGPEVNHPYFEHSSSACCAHCGGGRLHKIHQPPYNVRRSAEVLALEARAAVVFDTPAGDIPLRPKVAFSGWSGPAGYAEREH